MSDVVIIGIGNLIKSDDGAGLHVIRSLEGRVPSGVELVEGSVYCADLFNFLDGPSKAIFVDAIDCGEEPGAVFRFTPQEVKQKAALSVSVHDFGLYELIMTSRLMGQCPEEVVIFAIQVDNVEFGDQLTEKVAAVIPEVCDLVLAELEREGPGVGS
ncbi:MAG TPA: hydrogenase maturation protease [Candidatus Anoxymicrobiaceae bacterium]